MTSVSESRFLFKIVAVGDGRVGKTSLIRRFAENKFDMNYLPTLGVDIIIPLFQLGTALG